MTLTRYLFFTGKGGVGKTSIACAMADNLANTGKKVLLLSTDPASNLDDVLETKVGQRPTAIPGIKNLWAINLDPEEAAREYREQVVGSYRGVLPDAVITSMEEQLSGACTVEIAAFDLFSGFLTDNALAKKHDHLVFDTAPTGHTLRLLSLPKAWSGFLGENLHGTSCVGPLAGLQEKRRRYEYTVSTLSDAGRTTLLLVTRPETSSLIEAARASGELHELGLTNQQLMVNGLLHTEGRDEVALAMKRQQSEALEAMPEELKQLPRRIVPFLPAAPVGIKGLKLLGQQMHEPKLLVEEVLQGEIEIDVTVPTIPKGLGAVIKDLGKKKNSIVLVMGKGGVGKTTVAAATALALFQQGHRVHLSTTDPAAHLEQALAGFAPEDLVRFSLSRIDPAAEVEAYRREIMATVGEGLDPEGRELLQEDLASPCTEEIAVFRAFARIVDRVEKGFVVLDTAPTGHTLLLLDNTQSYHREVERGTGEVPEEVKRLLPRLRNPELTHVLIVTLPQATPVLEAARLQEDLRRAEIEPYWWVINQTWTGVPTNDPVLKKLPQSEAPWLEKVANDLAERVVRIPWLVKEPKGQEGLKQLL